jgi:hypothetical protein
MDNTDYQVSNKRTKKNFHVPSPFAKAARELVEHEETEMISVTIL